MPVSVTETSPAEWHLSFVIPELRTISCHVAEAISTGVVTSRARQEIAQVLYTYITAHMLYPTSEQYKAVCSKLIIKFPSLKDTDFDDSIDKNSGYVSLTLFNIYLLVCILLKGSWKLAL